MSGEYDINLMRPRNGRKLTNRNTITSDALQAFGMQQGTAATTSYTFPTNMYEFVCLCDSGTVTFTIGLATWTINAGEVFDEAIVGAPFTGVTFVATGNFRFYGRG